MRRFFRRRRLDAERAEEMQAHLDHYVDDLVARGYGRDAARWEARRRFGNPTAIREEIYEMNSLPILETISRDVRYGLRMLRKAPGFTAAAVLTLALGIGANTAVFSVVNALLIEPPPYPHPDRLGLLQRHMRSPRGEDREIGADGQMWLTVRDNATTVDAAAVGGISGVNLVANGQVSYVQQQRVSAGYFHVLGFPPLIGREFSRDEDRQGGAPVVVLSGALWHRVFNSDPSVVGKAIQLRGQPFTVIGVLPDDFPVTESARFETAHGVDLWTPLKAATTGEGGGTNYSVVARLHDGVGWDAVQNELLRFSRQAFALWKLRPDVTAELAIVPMEQAMTQQVGPPVLMLWGAVGIVLLIACVNIAGLLLARGTARTREIATRMAFGSGRAAVVRQLLVESVLLALAGGALGLLCGWAALRALAQLGEEVFDLWQPVGVDSRVLAVTLATAAATSVVFGLVPALQASRLDVQAGLAETGTRAVAGAAARWPRRVLVVGEVALGVVLLVSAGLLVRTFVHLRDLNPGFHKRNLITASVSLQDARYKEPAQVARLFDDTIRRLGATPGIQSAGAALGMPYSRLLNNGFRRTDGRQIDTQNQITNMTYVTPGYFGTLEVPLRRGRLLTPSDTATAPPVAVINEAFVKMYFRDDDPVGRHIAGGGTQREIVGVIGNIQQGAAGWGNFEPIAPLPCVYIPLTQTTSAFLTLVHTWFQPAWVVRSTLPMSTTVQTLRQTVAAVDPLLPIAHVNTIDDLRDDRLKAQQFMMSLVTGLGVIALLLAAIGIHGLIATSVTERRRELGIRLALGASAARVLNGVVMQGLALCAVGVAIGIAGAFAAARLLRSFLYGVGPTDPATFAGVIVTLLGVALVASLVPALRVMRLDPATTLRAE